MVNETPTVAGVVARTAPPLAVSGAPFLGVTIPEWVGILTIIYTTFQILRLLPKMYSCALCFSRAWKCKKECKQ